MINECLERLTVKNCLTILYAANCPAGSYSSVNRTCALCPLGSYQSSVGQMDCLPCRQGFTTASPGAVSESQCEGGLLLSPTTFMIRFQTAVQSYFVGQII